MTLVCPFLVLIQGPQGRSGLPGLPGADGPPVRALITYICTYSISVLTAGTIINMTPLYSYKIHPNLRHCSFWTRASLETGDLQPSDSARCSQLVVAMCVSSCLSGTPTCPITPTAAVVTTLVAHCLRLLLFLLYWHTSLLLVFTAHAKIHQLFERTASVS